MNILRVKNWRKFQHYKGRTPPWIKLERGLLDDFDFACLPLASKALAPMIWLIASESQDGSVRDDVEWLAFRLRWPSEDVRAGLTPLIEKGFLIRASDVLASCTQDACAETEGEGEGDKEGVCDAREIRPEVSAAKVLRERKLMVTPSHPDLVAACREGVTPEDLIDMASLYPDKPAGYVIAACRRQHAEQANPVKIGESHANRHRGRKASTVERTEAALQGFLAEHGA